MDSLRRRHVAALLLGYLAYSVGLLIAARSQPTGYELSIYRATPAAFWVGAAVGMAAAVAVGLRAAATTLRSRLALLLGSLVGISVAILPMIRDYYYYGSGDSLSYLGWTRMIADGTLNPAEFLYPGINTIAVVLTSVTGLPLRRTLQLVVPVFLLLYVVFTALCVTRLAARSKAAAVGTFFALLLLPINNIHTYISPYPTSAAIFLTPFALYLLLRYVGERDTLLTVRGHHVATPLGLLLTLAGISAILVHPQSGSNVLLIIGAGFGLQLLAHLYGAVRPVERLTSHRSLAPQTALVGLFFLLWIPRFDRATGTVSAVVNGLLYGANPGDEIATVGTSLATLGSGIGELFVKIFLVSAVLSVLAGAVMVWALSGGLDERHPDRNGLLRYVAVGFVPVFVLFCLFYLTSVTRQPFRYLGFIMVFVTVLAAVAVTDGIPFSPSLSANQWQLAVGIALALMLVPQAMVVHQSPYMYKDSDHVPETYVEGHVTSFEQRDPDVYFAGPRGGPRRYLDAHYGTTTTDYTPDGRYFPGKEAMIPFSVFGTNTSDYYSRCRYVPLTTSDYQREVGLYDGFRYSADAFRSFTRDPAVSRVQTNGDYRLYYVRGADCTG